VLAISGRRLLSYLPIRLYSKPNGANVGGELGFVHQRIEFAAGRR